MIKSYLLLLVVLLLVGSSAQELQLTQEQLNDPALLTQLNNYFGCRVWNEDSCIECSQNYYFNKNGVCCKVQGQCQQFNLQEGICEQCYEGYQVIDGKCEKTDINAASNIGCAVWANGVCTQCSKRWYPNAQNVCVPVSDLCSTWDAATGVCLTCYYGSIVQDGQCVVNTDTSVVPESNLLCKIWSGEVCSECSERSFFNADGLCVAVSANCNTFDRASGACLTCFQGYDLQDGQCIYSPANTARPSDLGCGTWDWTNQVCLACSNRWAFNADKICVPVAEQCASHADNGDCTACYQGYDLSNGECLYSLSNTASPADLGCGTWDWSNQVCLVCSNGWFKNADGVCTPVSDQCATHAENGDCTSCYKGYDLTNGACVFGASNTARPSDLGCGTWDWDNQVCLACSAHWFKNSNGQCVPVADQCKTNADNGDCTACYQGYDLTAGQCLFSAFNNAKPADAGCGTWDWFNQICIACSDKWVFNSEKVCVPVSDQCATHAENGDCLTCFKGYDLVNGACVFSASNNANPSDIGCANWDWDNLVCLACSDKWVFNGEGVCVAVNDHCSTHGDNGNCLTCYKGYDLQNGACVYSADNTAHPADLGCGTWDWDNRVCLVCSNGWVKNADGVCVPVSDQCATHAENGDCLTCFKGYDLVEGVCVYSADNTAHPADLGCGTWDWDNRVCLSCSRGWVFNADKACVPVSDQCASHADNGDCTSCFKGYDLVEGRCLFSEANKAQPSDLGCASWDWENQVCLACSRNWVKNAQGACVAVSDHCSTHADNGDCLTCYKGYDIQEGQCVYSASNTARPSDLGCATWDWENQVCLACSNNWFKNSNGRCVPVADQCATHAENGDCTSCFKGYDLVEGTCIYSADNTAQPADLGCGTWDWQNRVCIVCSKGWVFNSNNVCVVVSDQCKEHATNGDCTSCFQGYDLVNGQCLFSESNNARPSDLGCGVWDWNAQVCLRCSNNWFKNSDGICVPVSDQCATHAENGDCLTCFKGYDLSNGQCIFSEANKAQPSDLGCGLWDWANQVCLQCSNGFVFNINKVCVATSDLCRTIDSETGDCTACYEGYDLENGQCVYSPSNNARPSDLGCATWDWKNQVCLKCSHRWFFNSQNRCVPVDDNCNNYADDGSCTSCFPGYAVNQGVCLTVNPLCKTLNQDGTCASCYPQNILNQGNCVPISKLANLLLYYAECCPEKLAELQAAQNAN